MIIVTTWGFLNTYLCHEVHGKDEWVMLQLEDWNSKPMSCRHCLNHTGSLKELFLRHHPEFYGLKFLFPKTWNRSICIHIVPLQSNSSPKLILKSLPVKLIVFPCKSWSELMWRCKLRLRWLFLDWWKYFLGFPVILGETRIRILEFGGHLTEFGRAWKAQT